MLDLIQDTFPFGEKIKIFSDSVLKTGLWFSKLWNIE